MAHPGWAIAILFAVFVVIAVIVVLTWVSSRGVFMFLDSVVRDRVEIAKPWREYQKEGNSLFVWRLLLGIASFAAFGLIIAFFFARGADLYESGMRPDLPIMFIIGLGLVGLAVALIWGYIILFLKDFVAPLMYKNRISCGAAWKLFLGVFRKYPFHFIGYGIIIFLLMIAFAIAVIVAGLATCCIGFLILVIPYISTVVTLPVWYTYRAFSLEFLAQFGPEYDVLAATCRARGAGTGDPRGLTGKGRSEATFCGPSRAVKAGGAFRSFVQSSCRCRKIPRRRSPTLSLPPDNTGSGTPPGFPKSRQKEI